MSEQPLLPDQISRLETPALVEHEAPVLSVEDDLDAISQGAEAAQRLLMPVFSDKTGPYYDIPRELPPAQVQDSLAAQVIAEVDRNTELHKAVATTAEAAKEWRIKATHDSLTGLLNAGAFVEKLKARIAENDAQIAAGAKPKALGLVYIDLNNFSSVNNDPELGHDVGDHLLRAYADRVLNTTLRRRGDTLGLIGDEAEEEQESDQSYPGRKGGDEFVGIVDLTTSGKSQRHTANKQLSTTVELLRSRHTNLMEHLEYIPELAPYATKLRTLELEQAIGALLWRPGMTAEQLIKEGDRLMYRDKGRIKAPSI